MMFTRQTEGDERRLAVTSNFHWWDTASLLLDETVEQGSDSHFQVFCENKEEAKKFNYSGENYCSLNMASSLLKTKSFLESNISKNPQDWTWGSQHIKEYMNLPWSKIPPFKPFFHRSVPADGNSQTVSMSKLRTDNAMSSVQLKSTAGANFKMLI